MPANEFFVVGVFGDLRKGSCPSFLGTPTMIIPEPVTRGALCTVSKLAKPEHTRWSPDCMSPQAHWPAGRDSRCVLSGDRLRALNPRPLAGSEAAKGAQEQSWRVLRSGVYEAPPSSPGSGGGRSAQIPVPRTLSSPQSPPTPPQPFPKSLLPCPSLSDSWLLFQSWPPFFLHNPASRDLLQHDQVHFVKKSWTCFPIFPERQLHPPSPSLNPSDVSFPEASAIRH